MKKKAIIIGICVLLVSMPITVAISPSATDDNSLVKEIVSTDDSSVPSWAQGSFNGSWAYDFLGAGIPWPPLGNISGYYSTGYHWNVKFCYFMVDFKYYSGENATILNGVIFGPYMFGNAIELESGNKTAFVGIGHYNASSSEFLWRLMSFKGPTFFMSGKYTKFEE